MRRKGTNGKKTETGKKKGVNELSEREEGKKKEMERGKKSSQSFVTARDTTQTPLQLLKLLKISMSQGPPG